jgi:Tol biopolymer transport system component
LSADGRYLAFTSLATNLTARGSNGQRQAYVKDMDTGVVRRVSSDLGGNPANVPADSAPAISDDGDLVVLESLATDLVPGGTNGLRQVYVSDLGTGLVRLVSSDLLGRQATGGASSSPAISGDGRLVAFESLATNLVPAGSNGLRQIYTKNLDSGLVRLVSASFSGDQGDEASTAPSVSVDGELVSFSTLARNLVPGGSNAFRQILVKGMDTGLVAVISANEAARQGNNTSDLPSVSADGVYVVFQSLADNLVENDRNTFTEIFRALNPLTRSPAPAP